ncbi:MAG: maltose/maltodextrin ABC transporter substrate-binding protein MalE [Bacteriovoracaceae bacterium]|nr:maltose/maltodextrin ABC transporter substrate-binding protein MalE [Bacteriovoracaceae bacterium]
MKALVLIFIGLLSFRVLADDGVIDVWTSSENVKNAIESASKGFSEEFGRKVKITVLSKDLTSQFRTAALTGKGPDIFAWAHDVIGDLAESGLIEPIQMSPKLKKAFLPVALNAYTYKGKVYGYPYDVEAIAMIYNKKLISKLPSSMEEVVIFSEKIKKKKNGQYGFLYGMSNFFFSFPFLTAGGGYIFKDNGGTLDPRDVGVANKGAVDGLKFIHSLMKKGIVPESTDRSNAFTKMKEGKLAMTIDGPWAIRDLRKNKIDYGIAPIPSLGGKSPRPFVGTHGFIVRRSSKNKDLAKILIEEYLVTKKGIITLYNADPRGPARIDAVKELTKGNPDLKAFMESARIGIAMPNLPATGAVWSAMGNAISLTITGKESARKALEHAKNQILSKTK